MVARTCREWTKGPLKQFRTALGRLPVPRDGVPTSVQEGRLMTRRSGVESTGRRISVAVEGRIQCPVRGESDVDRCVGCSYLRGAEERGGVLYIDCRPIRYQVVRGEMLSGLRC